MYKMLRLFLNYQYVYYQSTHSVMFTMCCLKKFFYHVLFKKLYCANSDFAIILHDCFVKFAIIAMLSQQHGQVVKAPGL